MAKNPPKPRKRMTMVPRVDLIDRILEKSALLQQGPNSFANLCIEGILDAMDAQGDYEIPVLALYNRIAGKALLTPKAVMAIAKAFVPEADDLDPHEQKFLIELINNNPGGMTAETSKVTASLPSRLNTERIAREKELEKLENPRK